MSPFDRVMKLRIWRMIRDTLADAEVEMRRAAEAQAEEDELESLLPAVLRRVA